MLKSICFFTLVSFVLIVASSEAYAQDSTCSPKVSGWVDLSVENSDGETTVGGAKLLMSIDANLAGNDEVDLFMWAQTGPGYHQLYGGPTWTPSKYLSLGAGPGVERSGDKVSLRVGGYVYVGKDRFGNVFLFEFKGSGPWYKNQTSFNAGKGVTLSVVNQRFAGTGPEVEYRIPKTKVAIRANALTQRGGTTTSVAVKFYF